MMALTPKQEKFAQLVADGMTQADAYRTAYNCKKISTTQIESASKLMSDPNIYTRVAELKEMLVNKALWTKEDSINKLKEALEISDKPQEIVQVIKELNAMHGFNAPIKTELSGSLTIKSFEEFYGKS